MMISAASRLIPATTDTTAAITKIGAIRMHLLIIFFFLYAIVTLFMPNKKPPLRVVN
jgi:hypothetical protein